MSRVIYNGKKVSDVELRQTLERISELFDSTVVVTSGNRSHVPRGGSRNSWHLKNSAVDFYVKGYSLEDVYFYLKVFHSKIFRGLGNYKVIHHGPHTKTTGAHIHLGKNPEVEQQTVKFVEEGLYPSTRGFYGLDIHLYHG